MKPLSLSLGLEKTAQNMERRFSIQITRRGFMDEAADWATHLYSSLRRTTWDRNIGNVAAENLVEAPWAYKIDGFLFQAKHIINMSARFGRLENVFGNKRLGNFHSADGSSRFRYVFIFISHCFIFNVNLFMLNEIWLRIYINFSILRSQRGLPLPTTESFPAHFIVIQTRYSIPQNYILYYL